MGSRRCRSHCFRTLLHYPVRSNNTTHSLPSSPAIALFSTCMRPLKHSRNSFQGFIGRCLSRCHQQDTCTSQINTFRHVDVGWTPSIVILRMYSAAPPQYDSQINEFGSSSYSNTIAHLTRMLQQHSARSQGSGLGLVEQLVQEKKCVSSIQEQLALFDVHVQNGNITLAEEILYDQGSQLPISTQHFNTLLKYCAMRVN